MKKKNWIIWAVVAVVIVVIGWFSFGHSSQTSSKTVTVGVVGQTSQDEAIWKEITTNQTRPCKTGMWT